METRTVWIHLLVGPILLGYIHMAPTSTRLAGGRMSSEGRLEVFHSGRWGTVCDDNFGANDATAICVMLGFMSGVMQSSVAGPGSGTIWMDELECPAVITTIDQCAHRGWERHDCSHSEDVRLKCSTPCQPNPCQHDGTCYAINKDTHLCVCTHGYRGSTCGEIENPCTTMTCLHGGTCQAQGTRGVCQCPPGYSGAHCEDNLDGCSPNPCQKGICSDEVDGYKCQCFPGWTGVNCDSDAVENDCFGSLCAGGSTCVPLAGGGYKCECPPGRRGEMCDKNDPCTACSNYTLSCEINDRPSNQTQNITFNCICQPGFEGELCQSGIDECVNVTCQNGGTCRDDVSSYSCDCQAGFTGKHCETDVDDCASIPCERGGTCTDLIDGYLCTCPTGFTGHRCEQEVNECLSAPCAHGGTCLDGEGWYICRCSPGYVGERCEKDACEDFICLHNSTCSLVPAGPQCHCAAGYTGRHCEIDSCGEIKCLQGSTCVMGPGGPHCQCQPGYEGPDCQVNINDCKASSCQNNGTCVDIQNSFLCICGPNYDGPRCEQSACVRFVCLHDSKCAVTPRGPRCQCLPGYSGRHCEINTNECESNPCKNGAKCIDLVNDVLCVCPPRYSPPFCEEVSKLCSPNPCNGGQCVVLDGVYWCNCPEGSRGQNCEIPIRMAINDTFPSFLNPESAIRPSAQPQRGSVVTSPIVTLALCCSIGALAMVVVLLVIWFVKYRKHTRRPISAIPYNNAEYEPFTDRVLLNSQKNRQEMNYQEMD